MVDITPEIWRLIRVPDAFTLHRLHRVLQIVFSRLDYHLYEFQVNGRRFEAPLEEAENENSEAVTLADLALTPPARFTYIYDFGDDWHHDIVVEQVLPMPDEHGPDWSPRLIDGARAAPPEDAGGAPGFMRFMDALRDKSHPEHAEMRRWVGRHYDPSKFDVWATDHALALAVGWDAI
jgi:hypothetical protein